MAINVARNSRLKITRYRPIGWAASVPIAAVVGFFILLPTAKMLQRFLTIDAFAEVFTDDRLRRVLWITLWQATASTVTAIAVGLPLAVLLARRDFRGRRLVNSLLTLPFVLPTVVVALAAVTISDGSHPLLTIILTHAYFNVAVVLRIVQPHLKAIGATFESSAAVLGASPWRRLINVEIPMARRSIQQAGVLVFIFCFTSFGVVRIIGGLRNTTTEVEIFVRAIQLGDMPTAVALSVIQAVVVALVLIAFRPATPPRRTIAMSTQQRLPLRTGARLLVYTGAAIFAAPLLLIAYHSVRIGNDWTISGWRGLDGSVIRNSLTFAVIAAVLCTLAAAVMVVAVIHGGIVGRILSTLGSAPIFISAVVLGVGIVATFNTGILDIRGEAWLLPALHVIVGLPICYRIMRGPVEQLTSDHRDAAATLGASALKTIATVDLAATRRVASQCVAVGGCISLGEFGATSVLTRGDTRTVPIEISRLLGRPGDINQLQAYALATLLLLAVAVLFITLGESDA